MKRLALFAAFLSTCFCSYAQLSGTITDSITGEKIPGATIVIENTFLAASTSESGEFNFPELNAGHVKVRVTHVGFQPLEKSIALPQSGIRIALTPVTYLSEEVVVTATRAADESPTAFTLVTAGQLEKKNLGQDIPFLLQHTPSLVVTSDAGAGIGYTGVRIRGLDATHINVTINGIPVNDAEEQGVFWVDLPDLVTSVSNLQIQRGVGTSTNGPGAFGGSINILTSGLTTQPEATLSSSTGSFNTWKNTLSFGTGLLKNKFAFDGRLSKITSDGFVDRASSDLKSFYLSGGYYGTKNSIRAVVISGKEKTYQSWNGVPEAKLRDDEEALQTHYYNNLGYLYNTAEDSVNLFESDSRTYNVFNYRNQTDNYQQDYYQLHYSHAASGQLTVNASAHYTRGEGYYEEFKYNQMLSAYNLSNVINGQDTIYTSDLVRQKWLDNDFYGITLSSLYETKSVALTIGAAAHRYDGIHFEQVVWFQRAGNGIPEHIYSEDDAVKKEYNFFGKILFTAGDNLHLFADLQFRKVDYRFIGPNPDLEQGAQKVRFSFFNPKAGLSYTLAEKHRLYASAAVSNKEPIRKDFVESSSATRPKPEKMIDIEAGYKFSSSRFSAGVNIYSMNYSDQLILTGEINDVGEYSRTNVEKSFRRGLEFETGWTLTKQLSVSGNVTLSQNKIKEFTEYIDTYDADFNYTGQAQIVHRNTEIAFSPAVISSGVISWIPFKNLSLDISGKYVGDQFLDNTAHESRKLDAYFVNDLNIQYSLPVKFVKELTIRLALYNFLDHEYESNGYTYGYRYTDIHVQENFYYPQAGVNWLGGVTVRF